MKPRVSWVSISTISFWKWHSTYRSKTHSICFDYLKYDVMEINLTWTSYETIHFPSLLRFFCINCKGIRCFRPTQAWLWFLRTLNDTSRTLGTWSHYCIESRKILEWPCHRCTFLPLSFHQPLPSSHPSLLPVISRAHAWFTFLFAGPPPCSFELGKYSTLRDHWAQRVLGWRN